MSALKKCRENNILVGVSTSRSEQNSLAYLNELMPDILILSGGALVKYKTEYIYKAEFSAEETKAMGNAIDEVKESADIVIGSNNEDSIADFIENEIL